MATATSQVMYQNHYDLAYSDKKLNKQCDERKLSNKALRKVIETVVAPHITKDTWINDACFGKGQHFQKFLDVLTPHWGYTDGRVRLIGSDISAEGVREGKRRIIQKGLAAWFRTMQADLMGSELPENHPLKNMLIYHSNRHNIVNVANALQYSFQSEDTFQTFMNHMLLSNPDMLVFTYPDPEKIRSGQQFKTATISNLQLTDRFFGSKYIYSQSSTVVDKPFTEYLVDEVLLSVVLAEQGYDVIFDKSHQELVGTPDDSAVSLYKSVVYKKRQ